MTIQWEEITLYNTTHLEEVFELYDQFFPHDVREDHSVFMASLQYAKKNQPNNFRFLVGIDEGKVISFATGHYLADVNTGFIVYIATNTRFRNKGLGSQTLAKLEELFNKDASNAGHPSIEAMVLETEKEDFVHDVLETENCVKRNLFFERNGYRLMKDIAYIQPPLHKGEEHVPLNLFIKGIQHNKTQNNLKNIIMAIYQEKYSLVNGIDKDILTACLKEMNVSQ